jgi:hypothetical protein
MAWCWICFEKDPAPEVTCSCGPHRTAHPACLARWRGFRTGTPEERACRFCGFEYATPWRPAANVAAVHVRVGRRTKVFNKDVIADAPAFRRTLTTEFPDAEDRDVRFDLGDGIDVRGWDKFNGILSSLMK